MKLLTKEIEKKLPRLYETEKTPKDEKMVQVKFFSPYSSWTWYGVEYDPEEKRFFGLVKGQEMEWGYFTLDELQNAKKGNLALVERDMWFDPISVKDLEEKLAQGKHV